MNSPQYLRSRRDLIRERQAAWGQDRHKPDTDHLIACAFFLGVSARRMGSPNLVALQRKLRIPWQRSGGAGALALAGGFRNLLTSIAKSAEVEPALRSRGRHSRAWPQIPDHIVEPRREEVMSTILPPDEAQRMHAVRRYDILDTPPDGAFDRVTAIAARRFRVPIAIISIVDHDRIWFKSHHGVDVQQVGRDPGLCASVILKVEPHVLADARDDPVAMANPLVAGEFGLRFYAGVPLRTQDGFNLGTLCVIDKKARSVSAEEIEDLQDLASIVMDQMELRLSARRAVSNATELARNVQASEQALRESEARYRSVVEGSLQGIIIQQDGRIVYANPAMAALFGYSSAAEMIGLNPIDDLIDGDDLEVFRNRTAAAGKGQSPAPHQGWRARHRCKKESWMASTANASQWKGKPAVASFYFDITERKIAERDLQESQAIYRLALAAGRMAAWETDLIARTRRWTPEGMSLFGIEVPNGKGIVGGDGDEYLSAIHPDDRPVAETLYKQILNVDSFSAEYRVVRSDGEILFLSGRGQVISRLPNGSPHRLISIMADITGRKKAEEHIAFLMREMSHRVKNLLAIVQTIANQTARSSSSLADFGQKFGERLLGLSRSHDLLVQSNWQGAEIAGLIMMHMRNFSSEQETRIDISGPDVTLTADVAQPLGLALHELGTNAVKYGALSIPTGRVKITWTIEPSSCDERLLTLSWIEVDGPPVTKPTRKGFGHVVIGDALAMALKGKVTIDFSPAGFKWLVSIPGSKFRTKR